MNFPRNTRLNAFTGNKNLFLLTDTPGNNTVDMKMAVQVLIPSVQDGDKPDLFVETVFGKLLQGVTARAE